MRGSLRFRRRQVCLLLLVLVVPLGIAWRYLPLGLPVFAWKFGGSALWAVAVYWLLAALLTDWPSGRLAVLAAVVALAVELLKRVYWAPLDSFRETLAGKLLLGRYFTWGAIAAYWAGIGVTGALDALVRGKESEPEKVTCNEGHSV